MKNIPAIIPDRNTLDQFNSFCAPIFAQQKILEEQNHSLAMLRDSLLPKLKFYEQYKEAKEELLKLKTAKQNVASFFREEDQTQQER